MSIDEQKRRERAHAVGLFRYQLICPALDTGLSTKARGRLVREIAGKQHTDPFGASVRHSRDTLDRWIRRYRAGGFEELIPSVRALSPRTDSATLELAAALKRENPARTAAQVQRILRASAGWSPSESTLLRHFHRLELIGPTSADTPTVFGRFEAENPNDRWTGDALHGPLIGGRKTYLFAFLDDHSRLITGYRFGFSEDTVRLGVALEPALACRGVPASVYVDYADIPIMPMWRRIRLQSRGLCFGEVGIIRGCRGRLAAGQEVCSGRVWCLVVRFLPVHVP